VVFLIFVVTISVVVYRAMTPEQRAQSGQRVLASLRQAKDAAMRPRPDLEPFRDALNARTARPLVTPALAVLNAAIFVGMLFGAGALANPDTLVAWGANFGPRTTNGEWWRLVTMTFVHSGLIHLLVNLVALVQVGVLLERLAGHFVVAAVFISSGILASLASLAADPVLVTYGSSGAIFGMYGLLVGAVVWGTIYRSPLTIPFRVLRRLAPAAVVFTIYNTNGDDLQGIAQFAGFVVGLISGLVLTMRVRDQKPPIWQPAAATALAVLIAAAGAVPLRGVADVRPEIERVIAVEVHTSSAYQTALERFRRNRIGAEALILLIDRKIVPELHAARARLEAIDGVPREHKPLVAGAEEYLRLRDESWRLRAEGLRRTNMLKLQQAENAERASLEALQRIAPADRK